LVLILLGAAAWGAATFFGGKLKPKELVESAIGYIEMQGDNAMIAYLAFTVVGVIALVPTTLMEFAGGFLFSPHYGMVGTWLLTCLAKFVACLISVWMARNLFREWVRENIVARSELLTMVSHAVSEEPYKMAFLVRGSMAPIWVKNYGLGVLDLGYMPIMCGSCVFSPFYAFQNIYWGSACQDLKEVLSGKSSGGEGGWLPIVKRVLPIAFNVLLVVALIRAMRHQLRRSRERLEAKLRERTEKKTE